jgi:hypothetical protein
VHGEGRVPWDIIDRITLMAWVDDSTQDHLSIYVSLGHVCTYMRQRMLTLARRHVFCRSIPDRQLYIMLRTYLPKAETAAYLEIHVTEGGIDALSGLLDAAESSTALVRVYPTARSSLRIFPDDRLNTWLSMLEWLRPKAVELVRVNMQIRPDTSRCPLVSHPMAELALHIPLGEEYGWRDWSRQGHSLGAAFPYVRTLSITGSCTPIRPLLPLPPMIGHLVLEVPTGYPGAPQGTVHSWGLVGALKRDLGLCAAQKPRVRVTLLTGQAEPIGWLEAMRVAQEQGLCLERRIVL